MILFRSLVAAALLASPVISASAQEAEEEQADTLPALNPESVAIANEILLLAYPVETRSAMFNSISETMFEQVKDSMSLLPDNPEVQAALDAFGRRILDKSKPIMDRHIPTLMEGWANAYADMFTTEELSELLAFVKTETGQKFFQLSVDVLKSPYYTEPMQAYFVEIGELQRSELDWFLTEVRALKNPTEDEPVGGESVDREPATEEAEARLPDA